MGVFTEAELKYMQTQRLGRLATVNAQGEPQVAPVSFRYNPELDTIDIGGHNMGQSQKFRNIARNGLASFVIDDVLPSWKPRCLEIRGRAEALGEGGQTVMPQFSSEIIRLKPRRIIFFDSTDPDSSSRRDV